MREQILKMITLYDLVKDIRHNPILHIPNAETINKKGARLIKSKIIQTLPPLQLTLLASPSVVK